MHTSQCSQTLVLITQNCQSSRSVGIHEHTTAISNKNTEWVSRSVPVVILNGKRETVLAIFVSMMHTSFLQ